jgi:hypothetical protein
LQTLSSLKLQAQGAVMAAREVLEELTKIARANMADFLRAFACEIPWRQSIN